MKLLTLPKSCPGRGSVIAVNTYTVSRLRNDLITACAIATSCCISDVPSQWEGRKFDPPQLPHFSTDLNET